MSVPALTRAAPPTATQPSRRRWTALAIIAVAQLMIALDATIVSIALPSAQAALGASDADRQWVVTAYTLSFGGLLLLGGRIADFAGRKRAFLLGLAGFAVASMIGGAAPSFAVLVSARALQGAFAALLAPTALSLLAVTFTQPRERATAFAVYGSIAGSGAAIGLLLGGVLTQYLTWRWCLYVNLPVAIVAAVGGWIVLPGSGARVRARFDLPGVALATAGLVALVYACTEAVSSGWSSATVIGLLTTSFVTLALFVFREARTAPGALVAAAGMALLTQLQPAGAYLSLVLPAEVLLGLGISCVMVPAFSTATQRVDPREAGVASATVNAASQVGGSLGTALLNTVAVSAAAGFAGVHAAAFVHGFSVATAWGAGILVLAALVAAVLINASRPQPHRAT